MNPLLKLRLRALQVVLVALVIGLTHGAIMGMAAAFMGAQTLRPVSQCLYADGRLANVNTFAGAKTANPKLIGEAFSALMQIETSNQDILGQMEGPEGSGKPICIKTDLTKGAKDTVHFSTVNRPGGRGAIGEAALEAEQLRHGSHFVKIDYLRHGLGTTDKLVNFLAAGKSIEEAYADLGAQWFGLRRQADMMMMWRRYATALNTFRPNARASTDELLSTDYLTTNSISQIASLLKTRLAKPCSTSKRKVEGFTAEVKSYIILGSDRILDPIKTSSSAYQTALSNAQERGDKNLIWRGGYAPWDGQHVFHVDVGHEDTEGPLGMPIEPEALLGTSLSVAAVTDATTIEITGGGLATPSADYDPFAWFQGFAYPLLGHDAPSADSGVYYVVIYNVEGADAGKYGIYRYTGSSNNGNKIVCSGFLGATASGTRFTTLAGIAWDPNKHTNVHPTGSRIVQVNAKCVPYCYAFGLGAMAGLRCYGGPPIKPIHETGDWGFKKGLGFQAIYGQNLSKDTRDKVRNYSLVIAAYRPQGLDRLPTVTS